MVQNAKTNTTTKITTASQLPEHDLSFYGPPGKAWYLWLIVCVCVCPVVGGVHLQVEILPWATDNPPAGRESRTNPGQHPAPGKGREGKGGRTDAKKQKGQRLLCSYQRESRCSHWTSLSHSSTESLFLFSYSRPGLGYTQPPSYTVCTHSCYKRYM